MLDLILVQTICKGHQQTTLKVAWFSKRVHIPVTSEDIIFDTSEKCLQLMAARLAPSGSISVIWLHSRLTYFLNREPAPWSSESEMVTEKKQIKLAIQNCVFEAMCPQLYAFV